jgi:hypothetical protein
LYHGRSAVILHKYLVYEIVRARAQSLHEERGEKLCGGDCKERHAGRVTQIKQGEREREEGERKREKKKKAGAT